ncbi:cupin domain-containing protein, partial [Desulfamplus magnetovallimortis]|uniref:cupin domain-containing protein n=1 Tax=Desulfamplus magnetovallimortis TaxID=1246637 RepID=UPI001C959949
MDNIPQIPFHKSKKDKLEFEVFPLKHLFSRNEQLSHSIEEPHRLAFYVALYITKGEGRHYIDFKPYEFSRGSLLFISPGQVHAFEINPKADG